MPESRFWIGELAERAGTSVDTIRYYERIGVLPEPERSASRYRLYDARDLERLEFVRQAQALGLSLDEIGEVLALAEAGIEPCDHVRARLRRRLREVRERIDELWEFRGRLQDALTRAESRPAPDSCRCPIIESATAPLETSKRGRTGRPL